MHLRGRLSCLSIYSGAFISCGLLLWAKILAPLVQVEKNKDNILPRIMAVSGSYDKLFAAELKKYDPLKVPSLTDRLHSQEPAF